jgi:hypothetical protein
MSLQRLHHFQSSSPLLNKWKISELLLDNINQRSLWRKWAEGKRNLTQSQTLVAQRYNRDRVPQPFQVGYLIYYKNHPISHAGRCMAAKLMLHYKGPFRVVAFLTPATVRLVNPVSFCVTRPCVITEAWCQETRLEMCIL